MAEKRSIEMLVVEDDEGHAKLICDSLRDHGVINKISVVGDGEAALEFVYKNKPPDLILLDLNIPKIHGFEVLKRLKADERYKKIPVMILTSIDDQRDINKGYELGANNYITKPIDFEEFERKLKSMKLFLDIVSYPENSSGTK